MQLATDAARHADRSAVESVILVISELMNSLENTRNLEYAAE